MIAKYDQNFNWIYSKIIKIGNCKLWGISRSDNVITLIGKANGKSFIIKITEDKIDNEDDWFETTKETF